MHSSLPVCHAIKDFGWLISVSSMENVFIFEQINCHV